MTTVLDQNWLARARTQPVAFSQVREDPRTDLALLGRIGSQARVLMVASGGCTACSLISSGLLSRLTVVDLNPSQIALTKLKIEMLHSASPRKRMGLLGHHPMSAETRTGEVWALCSLVGIEPEMLGSVETWSRLGLDYSGRYELLFRALQSRIQADFSQLGSVLEEVMAQKNLVSLFGPDATANRVMPFFRHFLRQTQAELEKDPEANGPFLSQFLRGCFAERSYHWHTASPPGRRPDIQFRVGSLLNALRSAQDQSLDMIHLSNTLDWVDREEARAVLAHADRVLRPGGIVSIRQLNSRLRIRTLSDGFNWQEELSATLLAQDESFFYRAFHVGFKEE